MSAGKPVVIIFTANSNSGAAVLKYLRENHPGKFRIRCVVRKKAYMKDFVGDDVEVINADITQGSLLKAVFADDPNVAFWSTPQSDERGPLTKLFLQACIDYGVDFPIVMSMLDANMGYTPHQQTFKEVEAHCKAMEGTPVKRQMFDTGKQTLAPIVLRCAQFYQTLLTSIASIASGILYYPLGKNEGALPHVDLNDVAKVVGTIMLDPEKHGGKTYNLIGEYHQGNQIATAITMGTKHSVSYESVDPDTAIMAFQACGMSEWLATAMVMNIDYYKQGNGQDVSSDIQSITGDAPKTFRAYAKQDLKPILDQLQAE